MESAFSSELKQLVIRAALGALILLAAVLLLAGAVFMMLKPKLLAVAQAEMRKYGVEAQTVDMSLFGTVDMRNIAVPLHESGALRMDRLAVRPPLRFLGRTWLGGSGALYNLRLEKGGITAFIPELRFSGVSLEAKDARIGSHSLQMLQRLQASSLYADKIQLAVKPQAAGGDNAGADAAAKPAAALETAISGFSLSGLSGGKIARLAYAGMDSNAAMQESNGAAGGKNAAADFGLDSGRQSALRSGAFLAEKLDAAALYALAKSLLPQPADKEKSAPPFPEGARSLIGKIRLRDVALRAEDEKLGSIRLAAGELSSNGFSLKGKKSLADFITELPAADAKQAAAEKKQIIVHNLRQLLSDIAAIDIETQNVAVEVAARETPAQDAAEPPALPKAAAETAAKDSQNAAEEQKSVNDILDEERESKAEQERAALAQEKWKKNISRLPGHFKLSLAAFALTANHWERAIPYSFYVKVKDLVYSPGQTDNDLILAMQAMGRKDLQFSLLGDMDWDSGDSSLNIKRLAFYEHDMGGFSLQGRFLDIPQSFFDGKAEAAQTILNEAAVAKLEILLQDSGFVKNLMQWGTKQINISAKELRDDLYDIAVKSPPLLLKNREEARSLSKVFGAFIADSGNMRITVTAPPNGLKLSDFMAAQEDMAGLLEKLQLTADRPQTASLAD